MTIQIPASRLDRVAGVAPSRRNRKRLGWAASAAVALAAAAAFNTVAARRADRRYPPIGRIIDVDGVPLHVVDTGRVAGGSTIVLVHGNASLVQDFLTSGLVDDLRRRHRVILFDRPGYGHSARPDDRDWTAEAQAALLAAACDRLGVRTPVVVGHSWGTLVALAWALHRPAGLHGLVLLSGYYYPTARPDAAMLNIAQLPGVRQVFTNAIAPLQTRITGSAGLKLVFSPADVPDRFSKDMPFELMLRPAQLAASAADGAQMPANVARLAPHYGDIRLPVAIAWGDGDALVDQATQSACLVREMPQARVLTLAGVGHMIHHADPATVARLVEAVVDQAGAG